MKGLLFISLFLSSTLFAENRQNVIDSLQTCLKTAKHDSVRASVIRKMGTIYVDNGNYPKAIECFLKSKDLFASAKNEYGVFRCQNQLGITYSFMGDNKTALNYLLNVKMGIEDGLVYEKLGFVYYNENDIPKSLLYYKMALDFYKQKGDNKLVSKLLNDVGSMYELQGNIDTAISYYNQSLKMSKESNDKINIINSYASLGDIYFTQGLYSKSLEYENKSLELAKELNYIRNIKETHKILSDIDLYRRRFYTSDQ